MLCQANNFFILTPPKSLFSSSSFPFFFSRSMPPPLPPVAASLFAICCRCQLRAAPRRTRSASRLSYSPALDTPPPHPHPHPPNHGPKSGARPASRPPPSFGTSYPGDYSPAFDSPYRTQGPKTKSGRELIVIPPPGPKTPSACDLDGLLDAVGPLEAADLAELSQSILVYEQEAVLDATQMEISLLKPATTRVSKERFEQLYDQLNQAFNLPQLRNYYDKAARAEGPAVPRLKPTTKMDTIRSIMKHRWGMVIAEEIPEREDVIVTEAIESNKRDIFFLIGEGRLLSSSPARSAALIYLLVDEKIVTVTDRSRRPDPAVLGPPRQRQDHGGRGQQPVEHPRQSGQHRIHPGMAAHLSQGRCQRGGRSQGHLAHCPV